MHRLDVDIYNLLLIHGIGVDWSFGALILSPIAPALADVGPLSWYEIETESGRVAFGNSEGLLNAHFAGYEVLESCTNGRFRHALYGDALLGWVEALSENGFTIEAMHVGKQCKLPQNENYRAMMFSATLPTGDNAVVSFLYDNSMRAVVESRFLRGSTSRVSYNQLTVPLSVSFGSSNLTYSEAKGIASGDVILVRNNFSQCREAVTCRVGMITEFVGTINSHGLITKESEKPMTEHDPAPENTAFSVRLDFELASTDLSYEKLRTLCDGHIFDISDNLRAGVKIRCGWRLIALGELLELGEGRFGVQVTDILDAESQQRESQ